MKRKNSLILFLMLLSQIIWAQDSLSLNAIIDSSLNNNYDIQIAKWNEQSAQKQNTLGNAGFLPSILLAVGDRLNLSNRDNPTSFINGKITSNNLNPTIELNQNLFNGFLAQANKKTFELLEENSLNNSSLVLNNNLKAILLLYYQLQAQYLTKKYQEKNLRLSEKLYEYNKKKWDRGLITKTELDTYEVFVLEDSLTILNTQTNIESYLIQLERVSLIKNLTVKQIPMNLRFTELEELEALNKRLTQNPSLKSVLINEKIKQQELAKSKANLYPSLNLNAGYSKAYSRVTIESRGTVNGQTSDTYVGLSLSFNVFNGFKTKTRIAVSEIETEVAGLESNKQLFELQNSLKNYYQNFKKAEERLSLSSKLTQISNSTLNYWIKKEQVGLITSIQLRDFQKSVLRNKQVELNSWLEAYIQRLEIQSLIDSNFAVSFVD